MAENNLTIYAAMTYIVLDAARQPADASQTPADAILCVKPDLFSGFSIPSAEQPIFPTRRGNVTYVFDGSHLLITRLPKAESSPRNAFPNGPLPDRMSALWSIVRHSFLHIHMAQKKKHRPVQKTEKTLGLETLECRRTQSVTSVALSGTNLLLITNDVATSVSISLSGSNLRLNEVGTARSWTYSLSSVANVEIRGGAGNDRFVNGVSSVTACFLGNGGNDYLEGNAGIDQLRGGLGNDTVKGMGGNDYLFGGGADDVLLGGDGNDQMFGGEGNDQLNGGAGTDTMNGEGGNDILIAIDGGTADQLNGGLGSDAIWLDVSGLVRDVVSGLESVDKVQAVANFANGADKSLNGDSIADPAAKSGHVYKKFSGKALFSSTGPSMDDVRQGALGDCYLLAGLASIAKDSPLALRQNVVDFNDGTYGIQLGGKFYREDADLAVSSSYSNNPAYAQFGRESSIWVAMVEKAFAHYRKPEGTFASIEGGWSVEINRALGSTSAGTKNISYYGTATNLANDLANKLATGQAVTIGFLSGSGANIVTGHMYSVARVVRDASNNITGVVLRNPWGVDGGGNNDGLNDGYVTVTPAQLMRYSGAVNWGKV